ncbi:MAG TPA: hypothetical protein VKB69_06190 [Micromonosporaceae bacterium]|nr:hypothetical protein [Micromonosporaceae bacterium]
MNENDWLPDESRQPHTDLHRHMVDGGRHHEITVSADEGTAQVRLDITDPNGLIIGRIAGEIPAAGLSAAGDLLGTVLGAAGIAHTGKGGPLSRLDRRRRDFPNHGARWTEEDEALLATRFTSGASIADLRDELGRGDNSIRARLVQMGLLPTDQWPIGVGRAA